MPTDVEASASLRAHKASQTLLLDVILTNLERRCITCPSTASRQQQQQRQAMAQLARTRATESRCKANPAKDGGVNTPAMLWKYSQVPEHDH